MYINVSVQHKSNKDSIDELHNKSLKNRRDSYNYPNTFLHPIHILLIMTT
jgi:hypothetical protein